MTLTVVILTKNEALHIKRALSSVVHFADHVLVVDCGSNDATVKIAEGFGATIIYNPWRNYASQFNFALDNLPEDTEWVMRLDADEIVSPELAVEIAAKLPKLGAQVNGAYVLRRMTFFGRRIRWGGVFPIQVLRLFRAGRGRCEERWMDEHIIVEGATAKFMGEIVDDNLNSLHWWTEKHNGYASREVVDLLNLEYGFMEHQSVADLRGGHQVGVKRWLKEHVYASMPVGARAMMYFFYRYVIRLGFLDGREGTAFHLLQGFWYRYLVDMKLYEVKKFMRTQGVDAETAIQVVLGITVSDTKTRS